MERYCLGFVFAADGSRVLLIEKRRPAWQAGLMNGIGGKVEPNETPQEAMVRECQEEAGLNVPAAAWVSIGRLSDDETFDVVVFGAVGSVDQAVSRTDEPLRVLHADTITRHPLAPDVAELIQEARTNLFGSSLERGAP